MQTNNTKTQSTQNRKQNTKNKTTQKHIKHEIENKIEKAKQYKNTDYLK